MHQSASKWHSILRSGDFPSFPNVSSTGLKVLRNQHLRLHKLPDRLLHSRGPTGTWLNLFGYGGTREDPQADRCLMLSTPCLSHNVAFSLRFVSFLTPALFLSFSIQSSLLYDHSHLRHALSLPSSHSLPQASFAQPLFLIIENAFFFCYSQCIGLYFYFHCLRRSFSTISIWLPNRRLLWPSLCATRALHYV